MASHNARFPGKINDPDTEVLSERQAGRLAAFSRLPIDVFKGKSLGDLRKANLPRDRKSTRLNSSHITPSRMPSSA